MARTGFDTPSAAAAERLAQDLLALGGVGYVGLGSGQEVLMRRRSSGAYDSLIDSTAESTFYEELLVNPTLLKLARQRGGLDCGGLHYIAIGYGGFIQLILPMKDGHVSLGVAETADAPAIAAQVRSVLARHGRSPEPPPPSLLAPAVAEPTSPA